MFKKEQNLPNTCMIIQVQKNKALFTLINKILKYIFVVWLKKVLKTFTR